MLAACREKAPLDGAIRVSVTYRSYIPACVRVVARDARGNEGRTDILQSEFKNADARRLLVAVFRKPEWDQQLMLEVASYDGSSGKECSGNPVELHSTPEPLLVPLGKYAPFDVELRAEDGDGDTFPRKEEGVAGTDCHDDIGDAFPGAPEKCVVGVDFDCDGAAACQDSQCVDNACDDRNGCTQDDRCVGLGATAECQGQAVQCPQPTDVCFERAECSREAGGCVNIKASPEKACNDSDPCTENDRCGSQALCAGTAKTCNSPPSTCHQSEGRCIASTGDCQYDTKPTQVSCTDGDGCTVDDICDGEGSCGGFPTPCSPTGVCFRVTGGCTALGTCTEAPDPDQVNAPCASGTGVCRAPDGACSTFPYIPRNFDPDSIPPARIRDLATTCAVTFNSETLTWNPASCVTNPPQPIELTQGIGMVLFPLRSLSLSGNLRLVGSRPVILAVYGDLTLDHHVLANGIKNDARTDTIPGAGGNQSCGSRRGAPGAFVGGTGGGGGGAGAATVGGEGRSGSDAAAGGDAGQSGGTIVPLVGGCQGGTGGGPASVAGKGGAGGGAVQLSVSGTLTVNQWITTSASGGLGGRNATNLAGGGGGGGSGGAVLLEAHKLVLSASARVTANGGGGAEGGGYHPNATADGEDGEDGPRSSAAQAAGGRDASLSGGEGGLGGSSAGTPGNGTAGTSILGSKGGGGGGGGAMGRIRLRSVQPCTLDPAAILSPATNQCPL